MNKQKLTLLIVVIILILAVCWSFISAPRYKTVAPGTPSVTKSRPIPKVSPVSKSISESAQANVRKTNAMSDERVLRLDLLEREQSGFKGYRRNIFKPIFADEIKVMKQKAVAVKPLPIPPVAVVPPTVTKPVPVEQPPTQAEINQRTLAQFTFLGFLKKDNRKTVFLSKDKEIVLVRAGETFAKRYEAIAITEKSLSIKVLDTGEEIIIPLYDNKPLAAALK